ncbi:hypothetical protein ACQUFQ_11165 [Enterococcus gallinarum]|uniref:hypothetical protein n=1 Tax=Enterococcus gallinarum TaxID=1353 RepID=UPI003D0F21CA
MEIAQNKAIEKALSEVISKEAAIELANLGGQKLEDVYISLFEQMEYHELMPEAPTITSLLRELYELTEAKFDNDFEIGDLQYLVYEIVETLADLQGIKLDVN